MIIIPVGAFLAEPACWLRVAAEAGATHIAAPNFAFDLLVQSVDTADFAHAGLSLASIRAIMCAGEMVRAETVRRFMATFAPLGLHDGVFCPHYGSTEAQTVTCKQPGNPVVTVDVDADCVQRGVVLDRPAGQAGGRTVVSCGAVDPDTDIQIVDQVALTALGADRVGEIWIRSASLASGYRDRPDATAAVFDGRLGDQGGYFRSGDLGFLRNNELFIIGRVKDIIIINGQNYVPADLEATVSAALGQPGRTVVFGVDIDDQERVIAIQEISAPEPGADLAGMARKVVAAVSLAHGVALYDVVLVPPDAFTGVTKVNKRTLVDRYLAHELPAHYHSNASMRRPAGVVGLPDDLVVCVEDWLVAPRGDAKPSEGEGVAVVISARQDLVDAVRAALQRTCVWVAPGSDVRWCGEGHISAPTLDASGVGAALRDVAETCGPVTDVISLSSVAGDARVDSPDAVLALLQALAAGAAKPERVLVGASYTDPLERAHVESWLGFERSIKLVLPGTSLGIVGSDTADAAAWGELVAAELAESTSAIYANGERFAPRLTRTGLEPRAVPLRTDGVYLVTGGLGGLGRAVAMWLAQGWQARLVLVGRRQPNDADRAFLDELSAFGGEVVYERADVADAAAMRRIVADAVTRWGSMDGAFHAAGLDGSGSLVHKTAATFAATLSPKTIGTLALEQALAPYPVDFIVSFSSSAAILGDFGGCDYAVANRFLMSWARLAPAGPRRLVINWPLWRSEGMGSADPALTEFYLTSSGQRFLEIDEGLAILTALLADEGAQYLVLVGDADRIDRFLGDLVAARPPSVPTRLRPKPVREHVWTMSPIAIGSAWWWLVMVSR